MKSTRTILQSIEKGQSLKRIVAIFWLLRRLSIHKKIQQRDPLYWWKYKSVSYLSGIGVGCLGGGYVHRHGGKKDLSHHGQACCWLSLMYIVGHASFCKCLNRNYVYKSVNFNDCVEVQVASFSTQAVISGAMWLLSPSPPRCNYLAKVVSVSQYL